MRSVRQVRDGLSGAPRRTQAFRERLAGSRCQRPTSRVPDPSSATTSASLGGLRAVEQHARVCVAATRSTCARQRHQARRRWPRRSKSSCEIDDDQLHPGQILSVARPRAATRDTIREMIGSTEIQAGVDRQQNVWLIARLGRSAKSRTWWVVCAKQGVVSSTCQHDDGVVQREAQRCVSRHGSPWPGRCTRSTPAIHAAGAAQGRRNIVASADIAHM